MWAAAAIAGVSALLAASETAYDVLRVAGAAYLVWLGLQALWSARRQEAVVEAADTERRPRGFRAGFTSNLLNPKVGVFYLSFLPQFIPDGGNTVLWGPALAAFHIATGLLWLTIVARLAVAASGPLRAPVPADHQRRRRRRPAGLRRPPGPGRPLIRTRQLAS